MAKKKGRKAKVDHVARAMRPVRQASMHRRPVNADAVAATLGKLRLREEGGRRVAAPGAAGVTPRAAPAMEIDVVRFRDRRVDLSSVPSLEATSVKPAKTKVSRGAVARKNRKKKSVHMAEAFQDRTKARLKRHAARTDRKARLIKASY